MAVMNADHMIETKPEVMLGKAAIKSDFWGGTEPLFIWL